MRSAGSAPIGLPPPEERRRLPPPPPREVPIFAIQGSELRSPLEGIRVVTTGVVTRVEGRGFYVQDPKGDGDPATSDGVFVYNPHRPQPPVGRPVRVVGVVEEFRRRDAELTTTQIGGDAQFEVLDGEARLPTAVRLGYAAGRLPGRDADRADAFERLEGMRVRIDRAKVIGATQTRYGEAMIDPTARGRARPGQAPARLKIALGANPPDLNVGDELGPIEGVLYKSHGLYGVKPSSELAVRAGDRRPDVTRLERTETAMTVASFNLENLDPVVEDPSKLATGGRSDDDVGSGKLAGLARQIVHSLRTPDLVAVQEVQDDDGTEDRGGVSADRTFGALIDAIEAEGGPRYAFAQLSPEDGSDGGQPGGNIRVGYLYDPKRVELLDGSLARIGEGHPAFEDARKSLAATFRFRPTGETLHTVVNHWASKRGSTPTDRDPRVEPVVGGIDQRAAQAAVVSEHVEAIVRRDAGARVVSLGDFNAMETASSLSAHGSGVLFDAARQVPDPERYSYIFQGVAQAIDHQFASRALEGKIEVEYVHVNTPFVERASDHDPVVSRIDMRPHDGRSRPRAR